MKTILKLASLLSIVCCYSCNDIETTPLDFDVEVITVEAFEGEPVEFLFHDNPDYILFYSGEAGHEYKHRNRDKYTVDDIESTELTMYIETQYGVTSQPNYLSINYTTMDTSILEGNPGDGSVEIPLEIFEESKWNEIERIDGDPSKRGKDITQTITPEELEQGITLSARVVSPLTITRHAKFMMSGVNYEIKLKNGTIIDYTGSLFQWTNFRTIPLADGVLKTANWAHNGTLIVRVGYFNGVPVEGQNTEPLTAYDDWFTTTRLSIDNLTVIPETGVAIKSIYERVPTYAHRYDKAGTYTATFVAGRSNIYDEIKQVKEVVVVVKERP